MEREILNDDFILAMKELFEVISREELRNNFIDNVVNTYEDYKHKTFYTKGFIYDSNDRLVSKTVKTNLLESNFEVIEDDNMTARVVIHDDYGTSITFKMTDNGLEIDIKSYLSNNPKINKEVMTLLSSFLCDKLSK